MEAPRHPGILKLLPSFTDVAFALPILFLLRHAKGTSALLRDCDTGWHIRTGEWIFANHQVPARDMFSFSKPGEPWYAWEWLSDLVFAWLNGHGGLRAVVLFSIVLLAITSALMFRLLRAQSNPIIAVAVTALATAAASVHWLARPHLFTLLFLAVFYAVLERVRAGRRSIAGIPCLALLPIATVLWTNLHGGFFVGVLTVAVYGAGDMLLIALSQDRAQNGVRWRSARAYFSCAAACIAATLVNPYGYRLHQHIAEYLGDSFIKQYTGEFLPPNFHNPEAIYFEIMLALGVAAACWSLVRGRFADPLLVFLWAHEALVSERNIPIFAIAAAIPAARAIEECLDQLATAEFAGRARGAATDFMRLGARVREIETPVRWHLASVLAVLLVAVLIWAPNPPKRFRSEFDPSNYPGGALAMLRSNPSARIFTSDEWGDYLIWSLYPAQRVFVDGRGDFYGTAFLQKYIDVLDVRYGWEQTLESFSVDTILLPVDTPLATVLKVSSQWRMVFEDPTAVVFRRADKNLVARQLAGQLSSCRRQRSDREAYRDGAADCRIPGRADQNPGADMAVIFGAADPNRVPRQAAGATGAFEKLRRKVA